MEKLPCIMPSPPPEDIRIETATVEDMPKLIDLLGDLFLEESEFAPNPHAQERGLRLIVENPSRGRIFALRKGPQTIGMANLVFTVSTAEGGHAVLLEDVFVLPEYRGQGLGALLVEHIIEFARKKDFVRITLLTDRISVESQRFFERVGFSHSKMIPMRMILKKPTS
jgi:GNAT superfamily N-acetyltransferase